MPPVSAGESSTTRDAAGAPATSADRDRTRVLVVDDEPNLAKLIARLLSAHDVTTALSGSEALARIEEAPTFAAIVCDLHLPDMTGVEVFDRVAARWPALAARVVFITGAACTPGTRAFVMRSAQPVLEKPFDADALIAVVGDLVAGRGRG